MHTPEENSGDEEVAGDRKNVAEPKSQLAGGRTLPDLLFVTEPDRLKAAVGDAAEAAVKLIKDAGKNVFELGTGADPWKAASAAASGKAGVVIVGGYDVVPSVRLDCLPKAIRVHVQNLADPDDWEVWNDEAYADVNRDSFGDMPVSRIPDGHSGDLLLAALTGSATSADATRFGLRNFKRPFADNVFLKVPGSETMLNSEPTAAGTIKVTDLNASNLYVVLHGSSDNLGSYWGEASSGGYVEAMKTSCVGKQSGGTVFAGCCYGALTVEERPHELATGDDPTIVPASDSIALQFLAKGAAAFVGCTGAHYSPPAGVAVPYGADVLHKAFWDHLASGHGAAEALFNAKKDYLKVILSTQDAGIMAIIFKMWRQFKCLGLGW